QLQKDFRRAFKPLRVPSAKQLEKRIVPALPAGVVIQPGPFLALARRLQEPYAQKLALRERVMTGMGVAGTAQAGKAIRDGLKTLAKENREHARAIAWVEENYAGAYNRGFMDSDEKEKQVRKVAAVLIPFYLGLMSRNERAGELAVEALANLKEGEGFDWLQGPALKDSDGGLRAAAVRALSRIGGPRAKTALVAAAHKDGDAKVRALALNGLMAWKLGEVKEAVLEALKDSSWEVRALAVRICGRGRLVEAVEALVAALEKEKGRLRGDIDDTLFLLVGARYYGDAKLWKKWLEGNRDKVEAKAKELAAAGAYDKALGPLEPGRGASEAAEGKEEGEGATTSFYGITTFSKKIIYIIDISRSMEFPAGGKAPKSAGRGSGKYAEPVGNTKIAIARWQLHRAVHSLPKDAVFNIVVYSESYKVWRKGMVSAHPRFKGEAHDFIDGLRPNGTTNIYDSLIKAFEIAGASPAGASGKGRKKDKELAADTVFLLSDGNPNRGRITETEKILEDVRKRNPGIVLHTIGIGEAAGAPLLKRLAEENGGRYGAFR
ncbi:MAG: HEAT repeat domain-containing protein, partial [Planctomycetota bacterium]